MTTAVPVRKRSRWKWILLLVGLLLVVVVIGLLVGLSFVPGGISQVKLEYRVPPHSSATEAPAATMAPAPPTPVAAPTQPATPAPTAPAEDRKLYLTYVVPADLLQREVSALFPITEGVESLLKVHLRNPRFVADADGSYLRLNIDLEVEINGEKKNESYPGRAAVRTQLRYDPAGSAVRLSHAELAEFAFTGAAAQDADVLRPVLQASLASSMEGYEVFRVPRQADFWTRTGASLIRDVVVENGNVVVVLGR